MGDTHDDSGKASATRSVSYVPHLVVLLECDRPLAGGARYSLEGVDRVTIGRGDAQREARRQQESVVTLDLRLPGKSLSANHARLIRVGSAWAIEDLGSTNGTGVNGKRVARHVLSPNDLFEVGHTHMRVNLSVPTPPDAPFEMDIEAAPINALATLDPALATQFESLATIAPSEVPVLLLAESGTRKELVARWVHARTGRKGDFVAVNCGAIPPALVESSLFGNVKGAFSAPLPPDLGFFRAATHAT